MRTCKHCGATSETATFASERSNQCRKCKNGLDRYGMNRLQIENFIYERGSRCAICNTDKHLCIDHCHDTGKARGVLCRVCNQAIGKYDRYKERFNSYTLQIENILRMDKEE